MNFNYDELVEKGFELININNLPLAIETFNEAIKLEPTLASGYYGRGLCHEHMQNYEKALIDYTESIDREIDINPIIFGRRGIINYQLNNIQAALDDFQKAIENKEFAEFLFYQGLCFIIIENIAQALKCLNRSIEIGGHLAVVYYWRADCYRRLEFFEEAFDDYNRVLELDSEFYDAIIALAICYQNGQGVEIDHEKAFDLFEKAALNNIAFACRLLSFCYVNGNGCEKNYEMACYWLKKAAQLNDVVAQDYYGCWLIEGVIAPKDYKQAVYWFEKATEQNHPEAIYDLALCYYKGTGKNKDYTVARELFEKAASFGHDGAMNYLGLIYQNSEGVKKDINIAIEYFNKAFAFKNSYAAFNLAFIYEANEEKKDYDKAEYYYLKAIEYGNYQVYNYLGNLYHFCLNDFNKAYEYYQKAADIDDPEGCYNLGCSYYYGRGIEQDFEKAFHFFSKAASMNHHNAQNYIGVMYQDGKGVEQNHELSIAFFKKAHKGNNAFASLNLGIAYEIGDGVTKDIALAQKYYLFAIKHGALNGYLYLADLYNYKLKDYDKAIEYYKKTQDFTNNSVEKDLVIAMKKSKNANKYAQQIYDTYLALINQNDQNVLYYCLMLNDLEFDGEFNYPRNPKKAFNRTKKLLTKHLNDKDVQNKSCCYEFLARAYELGVGVKTDQNKSLEYYLKASSFGENQNICYCYLAREIHFLIKYNNDYDTAKKLASNCLAIHDHDAGHINTVIELYVWLKLQDSDIEDVDYLIYLLNNNIKNDDTNINFDSRYLLSCLYKKINKTNESQFWLEKAMSTIDNITEVYTLHKIKKYLKEKSEIPIYPYVSKEDVDDYHLQFPKERRY